MWLNVGQKLLFILELWIVFFYLDEGNDVEDIYFQLSFFFLFVLWERLLLLEMSVRFFV